MNNPCVDRLASVLVNYSAGIGPGDRVLIEAEPVAAPLVTAIFKRVLEAGGHPQPLISLPGLDALFLTLANDEQLDFIPLFRMQAYETFESRIMIGSLSNTKSLSGVDLSRQARRNKATREILRTQLERGAKGEFHWVSTLFPTEAYAQDAEMSLEDYERFLFGACHVDLETEDPVAYWQGVREEQRRVIAALEGHDMVTVRGPGCDLKLSIKGRKFVNGWGEHNMPDGEIYTGPVETSVAGWVRFTYPAVRQGREVEGVELKFDGGCVTEAKAAKNQGYLLEMLDLDEGSRWVGEFAFGTNFGVQRFTRNLLFDEKIGGTMHMALGAGYPETGSKNQSALHWDMICDLRREAEIAVDGEIVYRDGKFLI